MENNFDKSVLYGTTKNQFKGKQSETKGCAKPNMIRPQHVDKRV
jgi:hypothetical protein